MWRELALARQGHFSGPAGSTNRSRRSGLVYVAPIGATRHHVTGPDAYAVGPAFFKRQRPDDGTPALRSAVRVSSPIIRPSTTAAGGVTGFNGATLLRARGSVKRLVRRTLPAPVGFRGFRPRVPLLDVVIPERLDGRRIAAAQADSALPAVWRCIPPAARRTKRWRGTSTRRRFTLVAHINRPFRRRVAAPHRQRCASGTLGTRRPKDAWRRRQCVSDPSCGGCAA
jgi:hypothetical protein